MEFKIGDIITGTSNNDYAFTNANALMVVDIIHERSIHVRIIDCAVEVDGSCYEVSPDLFEITTPKAWYKNHTTDSIFPLNYNGKGITRDAEFTNVNDAPEYVAPILPTFEKNATYIYEDALCIFIDEWYNQRPKFLFMCNNGKYAGDFFYVNPFKVTPITVKEYFEKYPTQKKTFQQDNGEGLYTIDVTSNTVAYEPYMKPSNDSEMWKQDKKVEEDEKMDKLILNTVDQMKDYLSNFEYDEDRYYEATDSGCKAITSVAFPNKSDIMDLFSKSPRYDGKGRIVFDTDYERTFDVEAIEEVRDALCIYANKVDMDNSNYGDAQIYRIVNAFFREVSYNNYDNVWREDTATEMTDILRRYYSDARQVHTGQKVSKTLSYIGKLTKLNEYEHKSTQTWLDDNGNTQSREKSDGWNFQLAKFGDAINPLVVNMPVIISVNPIDFLGMSIGNGWRSCHSIAKVDGQESNNYGGCYSGGTLSYALDRSSIIMYYVHPHDVERNPHAEWFQYPKFKRCIFAWNGEDVLLQSRVYPDGRDGGDEGLAGQMRNIMQQTIAELLGEPNMWKLEKGVRPCENFTVSTGVHYKDYLQYEDCNVSFLKGHTEYKKIHIGHASICPQCGREHYHEECILCEDCYDDAYAHCARCGAAIGEDDDYVYCEDNGNYYCDGDCAENDGVYYCEDDSNWHTSSNCHLDDYDGTRYYYDDYAVETEEGNWYVNEDNALYDGARYCEDDGLWHNEGCYSIENGTGYAYCGSEGVMTEDGWYHDEDTANDYGWYRCEDDNEFHKEDELTYDEGDGVYYLTETYKVDMEIETPSQAVAQQ